MKFVHSHGHYLRLLGVFAFVGVIAIMLHSGLREEVALLMQPTAERAYLLGNAHFDASDPAHYDLDRARELYLRAIAIDPSVPYAHHQLARIEFLRSNFSGALELINTEIALPGGPASPSSYYIRALILGFDGSYAEAASDYREYLVHDPSNWAAVNDLAWVLLKDGKYEETITAIDSVLHAWPDNPWLYNSKAIALFELGRIEEAYLAILSAHDHVPRVTEDMWSMAYPGNDPLMAHEGVQTFRTAVTENMHRIGLAFENDYKTVQ